MTPSWTVFDRFWVPLWLQLQSFRASFSIPISCQDLPERVGGGGDRPVGVFDKTAVNKRNTTHIIKISIHFIFNKTSLSTISCLVNIDFNVNNSFFISVKSSLVNSKSMKGFFGESTVNWNWISGSSKLLCLLLAIQI